MRRGIGISRTDLLVAEAQLSGEVEVDESYFGGVRKGKRGRGAAGKIAVFGLLKRGGQVRVVLPERLTGEVLRRLDPSTCSAAIVGVFRRILGL
jgi:hypothetical protein